ncbi:MAG TPA: hybrid sensor histidine kinase/response regulator [Anaerolineae bacterium]|nr:hybrid sensor histidine kinase/response regulator [Anaerolineae bacterium]
MNTPPRILVVDDGQLNRDLLEQRLSRDGYEVVLAKDGAEGLEVMRWQSVDLVLLDIMMPVLDGFGVLEACQQDPALMDIPIIVISAADDKENVIRGIRLGAMDYLTKPFDRLLLQARVEAAIKQKAMMDKQKAYMSELSAIEQVGQELGGTLDANESMEIGLRWALAQAGGSVGLVARREKDDSWGVRVRQGDSEGVLPEMLVLFALPDSSALVQAVATREIVFQEGAMYWAEAVGHLVIPLIWDKQVQALLMIECEERTSWPESSINFLKRLAVYLGLALANAEMYTGLMAANAAKSEFVSFVAHELKVPMTSIKGYAEILATGRLGEMKAQHVSILDTIRGNVDRMATLVSDLDDISRIEAGYLRLEVEPVPMKGVIDDVLMTARAQIGARRQEIVVDVAEYLPTVSADRSRMIQVLTNLVSNANKYTPDEGKITIGARALNEGEQKMVHVWVADTGLGIKEEAQAAIFQKFYRVDDAEARKSPGTGLGLAITKQLVEMHQGRIWFESVYREGTTFHVLLPVSAG